MSNKMTDNVAKEAHVAAHLSVRSGLEHAAVQTISAALNGLLIDVFALYLKTKNFHWHVSGAHFRDFHLMFDEQSDQLFAMTDPLAERVRKIGGLTIRSIGQVSRQQRITDNDAEYVTPQDMVAELLSDNQKITAELRATHAVCDEFGDVASASLIENWIDESERRCWFLYECSRR
jgi:starvation-inducible DNA-binding protein